MSKGIHNWPLIVLISQAQKTQRIMNVNQICGTSPDMFNDYHNEWKCGAIWNYLHCELHRLSRVNSSN
jgi:hypothetical protein